MRVKPAVVAVLGVGLGFAQEPNASRVFNLHHVETDQDVNELATLIHKVAEVPQLTSDTAKKTIALSGPPASVAVADFLFNELDSQMLSNPATREYRVSNADDVVRVFFLTNAAAVRDFQEIATAVRSTLNCPQASTFSSARALAVRGTADQLSAAAWMIHELDQPKEAKRSNPPAIKSKDMPPGKDDVLRIFYLPSTSTSQQFQEVAVALRVIAETHRVSTYDSERAMAVRGDERKMALAGWIISELEKPVSAEALASETYAYGPSELVKIFYVKDAHTVRAFQAIAEQIRDTTKSRRVVTYSGSTAITVRGTTEQLDQTEQLLKDGQTALKIQ